MSYYKITSSADLDEIWSDGDARDTIEEIKHHLRSLSDTLPDPTITRNCISYLGAVEYYYSTKIRDIDKRFQDRQKENQETIDNLILQLKELK